MSNNECALRASTSHGGDLASHGGACLFIRTGHKAGVIMDDMLLLLDPSRFGAAVAPHSHA